MSSAFAEWFHASRMGRFDFRSALTIATGATILLTVNRLCGDDRLKNTLISNG
jgi:hypothetical protein